MFFVLSDIQNICCRMTVYLYMNLKIVFDTIESCNFCPIALIATRKKLCNCLNSRLEENRTNLCINPNTNSKMKFLLPQFIAVEIICILLILIATLNIHYNL